MELDCIARESVYHRVHVAMRELLGNERIETYSTGYGLRIHELLLLERNVRYEEEK